MERDGKYIYCIIGADCECEFGPIGIGGRGDLVSTIGFEGISMVVSDHPSTVSWSIPTGSWRTSGSSRRS